MLRLSTVLSAATPLLLLLLAQPAESASAGISRRDNFGSGVLPELGRPPIRVGSFNIQVFGTNKMAKKQVVSVLLRILERYDLVFIMEIRDSSGQAIKNLLQQLNSRVGLPKRYSMVVSDRLGRTNSKEQYAFFYRDSIFRLVRTYQYNDTSEAFERPPYGALFHVEGAHIVSRFGVFGLHASPRDAFNELEALHAALQDVKRAFQNENVLLVGDFNSDCSYMSRQERSKLQLIRDGSLTWLITACMETTTVRTKCLYDHIITTGRNLALGTDPESAKVFYFDKAFQLNSTETDEVSDHYPVELLITGELHKSTRKLTPGQSVEVRQVLDAVSLSALSRLQQLEDAPQSATGGFRVAALVNGRTGQLAQATATREAPQDASTALADFRAVFPGVLSVETAALVAELVARRPLVEAAPLPGYSDAQRSVRLTVTCSVGEMMCTVRLAAEFAACATES